jgi:hypothetical protein
MEQRRLCRNPDVMSGDELVLPDRATIRAWSLVAIKASNPSLFMRQQYGRHGAAQMLDACCAWLEERGERAAASAMRSRFSTPGDCRLHGRQRIPALPMDGHSSDPPGAPGIAVQPGWGA